MNTERNWSAIQDFKDTDNGIVSFLTREQWIQQISEWQEADPILAFEEWYVFKAMLNKMDDEELMEYIQDTWELEIVETTWLKSGNSCLWRAMAKDVIVKILEVDTDRLTPFTDILCEYNGRTCKLMFSQLFGLTDKFCPKCKHPLYVSDVCSYPYTCLNCDENFYREEELHGRSAEKIRVQGELERLVQHRMSEDNLNAFLKLVFKRDIKVEHGERDEDSFTDNFFTFEVTDEQIGGYFDIYYLKTNNPNVFYITEVTINFD